MARVYRYLEDDGPAPIELRTRNLVERYGAQAIYGRPLTVSEITRLDAVSSLTQVFYSWKRSDNWATWEKANPKEAELLQAVRRIVYADENRI